MLPSSISALVTCTLLILAQQEAKGDEETCTDEMSGCLLFLEDCDFMGEICKKTCGICGSDQNTSSVVEDPEVPAKPWQPSQPYFTHKDLLVGKSPYQPKYYPPLPHPSEAAAVNSELPRDYEAVNVLRNSSDSESKPYINLDFTNSESLRASLFDSAYRTKLSKDDRILSEYIMRSLQSVKGKFPDEVLKKKKEIARKLLRFYKTQSKLDV